MKNDVCIKAGSYCPICKGVVLADCRHDSIQFSVPMRYQRMEFNAQLQNEVKKLTIQRDALAADAERLEWLMRNVSGKEFRRLGVTYGGNCGRDRIDAAMKVSAGDTARPPTPTGWSDTDWLKHLQEQQRPLAGLHINQGSMDAAADAYEAEYNARHNASLSGLPLGKD